jgi:hypothetical protein
VSEPEEIIYVPVNGLRQGLDHITAVRQLRIEKRATLRRCHDCQTTGISSRPVGRPQLDPARLSHRGISIKDQGAVVCHRQHTNCPGRPHGAQSNDNSRGERTGE